MDGFRKLWRGLGLIPSPATPPPVWDGCQSQAWHHVRAKAWTTVDISPGVASSIGNCYFEMVSLLTNYSLKKLNSLAFFLPTEAHWKNVPLPFNFLQNSQNTHLQTIHCSFKSTTTTTFIPFHTNSDYRGKLSINKDSFLLGSLHNTILWSQNALSVWFV